MDWRGQLADKLDEVTTIRDPLEPQASCYRLRTTTTSGILTEATLKLRIDDLRPVEGTFQFGAQDRVEIADLSGEAREIAGPAPAPVPPPGRAPAAARRPEPSTPIASPATPGEEVRVFAALNRIGADLGDPIEVARTGDRILVTGSGVAPERQREVENVLRSMPAVVVRFSGAAATEFQPEPAGPADLTVTGEPSRVASQLEEYFGGHVQFEQFAVQILDLSEAVMSRAYALRRLAERFPQAVEAQLNPEERRLLGELNRTHAGALLEHANRMQTLLNQALPAGRSGTAPEQMVTAAGLWQPAAGQLFQAARRVELLLAVLVGGSPGQEPAGDAAARLASSIAQLQTGAAAYQRLVEPQPAAAGR
jgi:hypothetical protein